MKKTFMMALTIPLVGLAGCSSSDVPKCNSSEVRALIEEITTGKAYQIGNFVSIKNVDEHGFNADSQVRTCSAELVTSQMDTGIYYSVTWADAEHEQIEVNMRAN